MTSPDSDTKARILVAAEEEFLARGYERSRTQAIANRAGINKALLHYHFRTKEELFAQIFRERTKRLLPEAQAELSQGGDFIAFVCKFIDLYLAFLQDNPFLPSYLLQISANHPELLKQVRLDLPKPFIAAFEAEVRAKRIRPHDGQQFFVSLLGMCVLPFAGNNLLKHALGLDQQSFDALLHSRAEELKRCVVLLLTPAEN